MLVKRTVSESEKHRKKAMGLAKHNPRLMASLRAHANNSVTEGVILEVYKIALRQVENDQ